MSDRPIDPERPRGDRPFDQSAGFSGQTYRRNDEAALHAPDTSPPGSDHPDLPPDNGRRASVDAATGEVHGAGIGAGGGQPGEDLSSDAATGDGYPLTGGEGDDRPPGDLGPRNGKASYF